MTNTNEKFRSNDPYNRHGSRHQTDNKSSGGKVAGIALGAVAVAAVAAAGLYLIDLDQTQEARLPAVDVDFVEGQMPAYDIEVADVSLETETMDIEVPTMNVETETKTIEVEVPVDVDAGVTTETIDVPTLNIERPEIDNPADNDVEDTIN